MPTIFAFCRFGDFLTAYARARKTSERAFSWEQLRRKIGVRSASALVMISRGQRQPTPALLHKILDALALPQREREYAEAMVGRERATDDQGRRYYEARMRALRPDPTVTDLDIETFSLIGSWYYLPILEMVNLPNFRADPAWI